MALFPVTLLKEIQEQPYLFMSLLKGFEEIFETLRGPSKKVQYLIAVAEGSSKHALSIAAPFLESWLALPVFVYDPETLEEKFLIAQQFESFDDYNLCAIVQHAYFIAVSQSGETGSVLRIIEKLKRSLAAHYPSDEAFPLLAITNRETSSLTQAAVESVFIDAGEEKSIAATKTMTLSLLTILLWGLWFGKKQGKISPQAYQQILLQLGKVPQKLHQLWEKPCQSHLLAFSKKMVEVNHFVLLSKGPLVLILPEIGLKLTETSSNIVYTNNSESFKHGPKVILSGIQGQHPNAIYWIPTQPEMAESLFKDIRNHFWVEDMLAFEDDRVFLICFENSPLPPEAIQEALNVTPDKILSLPESESIFESLFMGIVSFQTISYYLAISKGENPDNPALEKAVTD